MKHIHFISITVIIILLLAIFLYNKRITNVNLNETGEINLLQQTILLQSASFNQMEVHTDSVVDIRGKRVALRTIFRHQKLVFRFTEENCNECIDAELRGLKELSVFVGDTNIVVLGSYARQRDFKIICQTYHIDFPVYNIASTFISSPIENVNRPYLFVLDSSLNVSYLFVPNKEMPDLSTAFYQMVSKLWSIQHVLQNIDAKNMAPTNLDIDHHAHRFGVLQTGDDATAMFVITNTGDSPLLIQEVQATCGCTVPEWTRQPVPPGQTASIKLKYDTQIKGIFSKKAFIFSNAKGSPHGLTISGEVQ